MKRGRLATLAALGVGVLLFGNRLRRLAGGALELRRARLELRTLEREERDLRARLERMDRSGPALEGAVRRELGYLRPGELEYRFPPPSRP